MRAEGRVFGAEAVVLVRFHDVDSGLVFVHRVQDNLQVMGNVLLDVTKKKAKQR